jgi:hypothetical protein
MNVTFTLQQINRTSARVLDASGRAVGHIGLMAGGSMAYVNGGTTFPGFAAHVSTLDAGLAEFIRAAS